MGLFDNIPPWALWVGGAITGAVVVYFFLKWLKKDHKKKSHHHEEQEAPKTEEVVHQPQGLTMALFWWKSCGPCKNFKPTWNQFREKYEGRLAFVEYEKDDHPEKMSEYQIGGFPTVMLLHANGSVQKYTGERSLEKLSDFAESHLGAPRTSEGKM